MKSLLLVASLFASVAIQAAALPQHRVIFEFPESAGSIRKMQVDLTETKGKWLAQTKSLTASGAKEPTQLPCEKLASGEFKCQRDEGGGGFELTLEPTPKLTLSYFTADEDGSEIKSELKAPKGEKFSVEGKKGVLSSKDAF